MQAAPSGRFKHMGSPRRNHPHARFPKRSDVPGNCYIHRRSGSITKCSVCGKPMCRTCATQTPFPHVCSFCHPRYYKSRAEVYKHRRFNYVGLFMVLTSIAFLLTVGICSAVDIYNDLDINQPDPVPDPTPLMFFDSAQIFPKLDKETFDYSSGKVGVSFKLYVTNLYRVPVLPIQVDIMILKNETIRSELSQTQEYLKPNSTAVFDFDNLRIYPGTYQAHFVLWQNKKVVDKETVNFIVNKDDVQEVNAPPPPPPAPKPTPTPTDDKDDSTNITDDDVVSDDDVDDDDDGGANWYFDDDDKEENTEPGDAMSAKDSSMSICIVGIVALVVVVIISVIIVIAVASRKGKATEMRKEALEQLKEVNAQKPQ